MLLATTKGKISQKPKYIGDRQYPIIRNVGMDVPITRFSK